MQLEAPSVTLSKSYEYSMHLEAPSVTLSKAYDHFSANSFFNSISESFNQIKKTDEVLTRLRADKMFLARIDDKDTATLTSLGNRVKEIRKNPFVFDQNQEKLLEEIKDVFLDAHSYDQIRLTSFSMQMSRSAPHKYVVQAWLAEEQVIYHV